MNALKNAHTDNVHNDQGKSNEITAIPHSSKEDASQIKSGDAPDIMNVIRKIAVNILKKLSSKKKRA